ncbi:MAG: PQQ-binding-like beta-propeller repeat protein, partial [Bdellovibrionota bacterium]
MNTKFGVSIVFAWALIAGCSTRNTYTSLGPDPRVLVREWTLSTHGAFKAGDRGFEYSNPILADQALIFGNQSQGLTSLYPGLNQIRWVLPIEKGVYSELAVEKDQAYFTAGDGFLYCVNIDTGRVIWKYDLHNPVASRPTVAGGRVFVTSSDDTVYAFDSGTGKWLWHYRRRSSPSSTIHGASSPLVDGAEVIAGLSDGFLIALNLNDGQLKWERKIHHGQKFTDVDAHPVLDNGVLYVPSYDGALYALKRGSGDVLWRFDAGGAKQPQIEGDRIYLPSSDNTVYALERASAKVIWKFELDGGTPTEIVATDRLLVFGSSQQYLYAIEKATGTPLYRYDVGYDSGFSGAPAWDKVHQKIYFLSGAGNLYAFAVRPPARKSRPFGSTDPYLD